MRKFHKSLILLTIFFACFFSEACFAATPADELKGLLQNVQTMQANFEQYLLMSSGEKKSGSTTSGKMALQRPGKFRWEISTPNKQLIIANKNTVWVYDEDLAQVSKRKINYNEPGNPAILLSGSTDTLQKMFVISKTSDGWFELRPKASNNMYRWVKLHFVDGQLVAMNIADNLGQKSEIKFSAITMNQNLSPTLFQLNLPKGVDVIDM